MAFVGKVVAASMGLTFAVQAQVVRPTAFDVVSVKMHSPKTQSRGVQITPGRFMAANITVDVLLMKAYDLKPYQLSGGPSWRDSDNFDVEGKPGGADVNQLQPMLQTLLAERFKLAVHREAKQLSVYDLVVAKNGPKLHELKEGETPPSLLAAGAMTSTLNGRENVYISLPISRWPDQRRGSMSEFATMLSSRLTRPVVDKTGLSGIYNTSLNLGDVGNGDDLFAPIQAAMQDQLGLRLEPAKAAVEILFIDHLERPDPN